MGHPISFFRVRMNAFGLPVENPQGGRTIGYICEADPVKAAQKASQLTIWSDVSFIAFDYPAALRDRCGLRLLKKVIRKDDIILVPTFWDISRYRRSQDAFYNEMEAKGVTVTVLEGLEL